MFFELAQHAVTGSDGSVLSGPWSGGSPANGCQWRDDAAGVRYRGDWLGFHFHGHGLFNWNDGHGINGLFVKDCPQNVLIVHPGSKQTRAVTFDGISF
jgi:hypothetical protein